MFSSDRLLIGCFDLREGSVEIIFAEQEKPVPWVPKQLLLLLIGHGGDLTLDNRHPLFKSQSDYHRRLFLEVTERQASFPPPPEGKSAPISSLRLFDDEVKMRNVNFRSFEDLRVFFDVTLDGPTVDSQHLGGGGFCGG